MKKVIFLLIGLIIFSSLPVLSAGTLKKEYWADSKKIKVYIEPNRRRTIVKTCFKNWINATGGNVDFDFIDFPKRANIVVEFVPQIPDGKLQQGEILGLTRSKFYEDRRIKRAGIQVPYKMQNRIVLDDVTLTNVLTHEIGHALGLGHSSDKMSIMYPTTARYQKITKEDILNLQKIYKW